MHDKPTNMTEPKCSTCMAVGDEFCHLDGNHDDAFDCGHDRGWDDATARIRRIVEGLPKYGSRSALTVNVDDLLAAIDGGDDERA